jgi:hypothetical protein
MEVLGIKLKGKWEGVQRVQVLVPIHSLSLNRSICCLCHCLSIGYGDKEFPLDERIFLDTCDIYSPKD